MLEILPKLPKYYLARRFNGRVPLPLNYTLSLTDRCNSRCKTCNIWKKIYDAQELSLAEWMRIFEHLGDSPYWVTLSGGEPFLRGDLLSIYRSLCEICPPAIINIPTNGLLTGEITDFAWAATRLKPKLVINLSIDHYIPETNDEIRGVPGHFEKVMKTYNSLKTVAECRPNLTIGFHTVISTYNVQDFPDTCNGLMLYSPHQYITEVAEERVELGNIGENITPSAASYTSAITYLLRRMEFNNWKGFSKITQALRTRYYLNVIRILKEKRQIIPCYAGIASVQISSHGDVWPCCMRGLSMGNLRESSYDILPIWRSKKAKLLRTGIKSFKCHCPLANASYTNMLLHPTTLVKVTRDLI